MKSFVYIATIALLFSACKKETEEDKVVFDTKYVVVVVIDGPRYSETWGDGSLSNIPFQASLKEQGVFYHAFFNEGSTFTTPGHVAVSTGTYQNINNNGFELPYAPSIFQRWLKATGNPSSDAWIIASKDKLEVLANCTNFEWQGNYQPSTQCGVGGGGVGSGYRHDSLTLATTLSILDYHHPSLVLVNLREPDYSGHTGDWNAYISGIQETDQYLQELWEFIESDPHYQGKTSLFVTNDHGRHLQGIANGFAGHGDQCDGCKHISLLAVGPDFNAGKEVYEDHELRDIPATIAYMMGIPFENPEGKVLKEAFNK